MNCKIFGKEINDNLKDKIVNIICISSIVITLIICSSVIIRLDEFISGKDKDSGVGIQLVTEKNKIVVQNVLSNMPAQEAGIKQGDVILKVNNKPVKDLNNASNDIRGKNNTKVKLTVSRNGEILVFKLKRKSLITK